MLVGNWGGKRDHRPMQINIEGKKKRLFSFMTEGGGKKKRPFFWENFPLGKKKKRGGGKGF